MKKYLQFIKPASSASHIAYYGLNIGLPLLILALVRIDLVIIAAIFVLLAKWRMFAVQPRYWIPNLRANAVDIFIGLSVVIFMAGTNTFAVQLFWTIAYIGWIIYLKPESQQVAVMAQALIAQALSLVAFYQAINNHSIVAAVVGVAIITYVCARHFFGAFDEPLTRQYSAIWAWFAACLTWVLEHWVLYYLAIPQTALVLSLVGYSLAFLYYLHVNHRLKSSIIRQFIILVTVLLFIIVAFSDWQDKAL